MQNIATQVSVTISSGTFSLELRAMFWEAILWLVKMIIILTRDPSFSFNLIFRQPETTVCLFSYAGFRKTQARVRMFSLATLATIVAIAILTSLITNLIFGGKAPTWAASFGWTQDDWSSGLSLSGQVSHEVNWSLPNYWKYFASSSLVRILTNGTLSLATTTTSTTTTNFSNNTGSNMYLLNGFPTQKKLDNARCATTTECSNGACTEDFNNIAQKYCHTNSNKCVDWISNASSSEYTNSFIHCSANSYSKTCNSGTWGATTTITANVCTPSSGANNGLLSGGWLSSNGVCVEGAGFGTVCNSCALGYAASSTNNGCYTSCTVNAQCLTAYKCNGSSCIPDPCLGQTQISYNGDTYPLVGIGTQCWFAENLRTTKKPDGVTDISATAYCNPVGCGSPWGRLYTWNTAMNGATTATGIGAKIQGICPAGWHIPSDYNADASDDFQKLSNYLGGNSVSGGAMKQTGTTYWTSPNGGATNSSGFAGVAAGDGYSGSFSNRGSLGNFWSSSQSDAPNAWTRYLFYNGAALNRYGFDKTYGFSVRCIKD